MKRFPLDSHLVQISSLHPRSVHVRKLLLLLWLPVLLLGACASPDLVRSSPPAIPFQDPNILGVQRVSMRTLETIDDALLCLASKQPVYGITTENSNVRPGSETGSCRVGRIPQGRLVKVDAVYEDGRNSPLAGGQISAPVVQQTVGYVEDVQPIVQRSCNSCHSGIVKNKELQVTEYDPLMAGSENGPVVVPGDPDASVLWQQISTNQMPMVGELSALDKETIRLWIEAGAPERRSGLPELANLWLVVDRENVDEVPNACPGGLAAADSTMVNAELIAPISCGAPPDPATIDAFTAQFEPDTVTGRDATGEAETAPAARPAGVAGGGIQAALGLPAPSDGDGWLQSRGGFCVEQRLPDNDRSITAISFAGDGRMFLAIDSSPAGEADPLILYDAYHPSRGVAVYNYLNDTGFDYILEESPRITGLDYSDGALYVTRAGEVGRIPDGGSYEPLAGGFAVNSQLFHANNGIVVSNGWVYVSAGGVRDGYSDGPLVGIDENGAQSIVAGGNPYAARIVRAPLGALLSERSIGVFQTAARGARNPYGITADPAGRIWWTDNGATNVPDNISAGDEINMLEPGTITGDDGTAPYFGFPLALSGNPPGWYVDPVVALPNTAAPTGITYAYGTIFYGQYGRDPGLYRLGRDASGRVISERVLLVWPLLAAATAPDGALWIGTGNGGLYRITPGCE